LRIHLRASGRVECKLPKECCCDNSLLRQFDVMQSILMMSSILATRTFFPMRYLSLPLGITRLRGIDFQKLEDKIFGKFTSKNWRNSTKAVVGCLFRRSSLLKLSTFLISLELANKVLNKINSLLRAYLFGLVVIKLPVANAWLIGRPFAMKLFRLGIMYLVKCA
jgi:hypothetical protein